MSCRRASCYLQTTGEDGTTATPSNRSTYTFVMLSSERRPKNRSVQSMSHVLFSNSFLRIVVAQQVKSFAWTEESSNDLFIPEDILQLTSLSLGRFMHPH